MSDIEPIVREVDSSMAMEGIPLKSGDKNRIRNCLTDMSNLEQIADFLIKKHTVPLSARQTA